MPDARSGSSFVRSLTADPLRCFGLFLLGHALLWTALPALLYRNLPLDLIEALTYGREWQLGYDKLPPLPWWLVEIVYRTVGHDFAYYLMAQVAVVAAFALVFVTARPLIGPLGALIAILIIDGMHYFNFTAAKFNHDVVQLPFWALAGYSYHRALRHGSQTGRLLHWLLFGVAIGISLWAKYFVVVLAAPLALFMLLDRDARRQLATPGPYLAVAVALIIMSPHLVWLVQTDFLPFAYAEHRAAPSRGIIDHIWHPVQFTIGQLFFILPALLIAWVFARKRGNEPPVAAHADAFDRRIITLFAFGPFATVVAMAAVSGRGAIAMWGYPLWLFLGVFIVLAARRPLDQNRLARTGAAWAVVTALFAFAFVFAYAIQPPFDHRYRAVFFPGDRLAQEITTRFRAITGQPLRYVVATMWDGGNVAHYSPEQPQVLIDGSPERAPWIDLSDLRAHGAAVVWTGNDPAVMPDELRAIAGTADIQPPFSLPYRLGKGHTTIGWAVLRPKPAAAAAKQLR
jgi:4-amino-4-deoxy-L-arabinose transferase-like glycosyltransferase